MKKYYLYAAISILCWSTVATIAKLLLGSMNSWQLLFISSFFAGLALLVYNVATKKIKMLATFRLPDYLKILGSCLPSTLLYYVFYYSGTAILPASQAFVINYLWPIMSVIFACLLLGERVTPVKVFGILLSFSGLIVVIAKDLTSFDAGALFGVLLCVLDAVSYGAFTALSRKAGYDKTVALMVSFFTTFLITGTFLLATGSLPQISWGQALGLVWNGACAMGLANTVWLLALSGKDTARISNLAYITPVLSMIWLAVFLKEKISIFTIIGLVIILLGVFVPLLWEKWRAKKNVATVETE